jgi:two-component system LytT family response regulator
MAAGWAVRTVFFRISWKLLYTHLSHQERRERGEFLVRDGNKETLLRVGKWSGLRLRTAIPPASGWKEVHAAGSIKELSYKLDPAQFVRIHRSAIVPIGQGREIHRDGRAEHFVVLNGGQHLRMSKAGWQNLIAASGW